MAATMTATAYQKGRRATSDSLFNAREVALGAGSRGRAGRVRYPHHTSCSSSRVTRRWGGSDGDGNGPGLGWRGEKKSIHVRNACMPLYAPVGPPTPWVPLCEAYPMPSLKEPTSLLEGGARTEEEEEEEEEEGR
ncbi:hypothetical protein CPB84DRAFT_1750907 [Gymnopilus junonius]|uniref:Uncharacterized protein n=1 Tax=Gymnopilus junonius TaxID=109634 RepID=A0A9P5NDQ4_GYMJU|nr:hypothetical protein CPB84DRAFT_1750907 [Gymnopilus junonius]